MQTMEKQVDKIPAELIDKCITEFISHINNDRMLKCKPEIGKHFNDNFLPYLYRILRDDMPYVEHIRRYIEGKQKSTIASYIIFMKRFFKWAIDNNWLSYSPISKMKPPVVEKKPRRILTKSDLEKIFSVKMTIEQQIIFRLLIETGCRRHEISKITLDNLPKINEPQVITIRGKGDKTRVCTISEDTLTLIRKSFESKPRKYLIQERTSNKPMHPVNVGKIFTDVMNSAGIKTKGDGMHMFRRSFITELHRKGVPLATIQKLVGHSNMTTTFGYIHVNLSDIEKLYELEIFQLYTKIYEGKHKIKE